MSSSVNEDQDQRNNGGLEDLTSMTIESLRARLLSERAMSRTSRQRADELAKRVLELEEQLKLVSLQRKKAEKATADVLAILESNGISDASEAFDSNSDQETVISDSKASNDSEKMKETLSNFQVRRRDMDSCSSSEIDSSRSTGPSLSWKSSKDSLHSLERKKYTETVRRRCSTFASNSSLPKRIGKSCRRIRRREARSVAEDSHDDDNTHGSQGKTVDTSSQACPNCADIKQPINNGAKDLKETLVSGLSENRIADDYSSRSGQDDDFKSVLQHQAQLEEQYEEDTAQGEWEEKVRENSSCVVDSCDPGNRSDVTEEREEVKASGQSSPARIRNSVNQQSDLEVAKTCFTSETEPKVSKDLLIPLHSETGYVQEQKTSSLVAHGSSSSEYAFPTSKGSLSQGVPGNVDTTPSRSSRTYLSDGSYGNPSVHVPFPSPNHGESSGSHKELALMPQKSSSDLESVLEALQQAKSSLNQKLHGMPLLEGGPSGNGVEPSFPGNNLTGGKVDVPVGCPGLFRLPTDFQLEGSAKVNYLSSNTALSLANSYPEPVPGWFANSSLAESRSIAFVGNHFDTTPYSDSGSGAHRPTPSYTLGASGLHASAMPFTEIRPGVPASGPVFEPALEAGLSSSGRSNYLDPQTNGALLIPSRYAYPTYPFYQEVRPQVPGNERLSRYVPSVELGTPSPARFSFYDDHIRPNMYK
ncbi:uncharacterized protein LOC113762117 isoform X1 [Coffea eugenioides]|uniref:uncharacterized protein LOC113762117 isoform X1 n=1 Tax=Coffea eugenioides TaxID=49369 RepID=UPI000F609459|nr:uncharacterized protein LOC113762117 isoform X1 [Coffea eugenioides]XP_027161200.1 uncharacterized protein LOC113762117 isoform X1 [Coffea eugenioides]